MNFKAFKSLVENEANHMIKFLRSNNGGDLTSNVFNEFCEIHGIKRQFSTTKTPQQNGVVERKNRTVSEATNTMINEEKIIDGYWREKVYTYLHIQKKGQLIMNRNKTPYELWFGRLASAKYFRVF